MAEVETIRIARDNSDGKGDYTIINARDQKPTDVIWPVVAAVEKKVSKKKARKKV